MPSREQRFHKTSERHFESSSDDPELRELEIRKVEALIAARNASNRKQTLSYVIERGKYVPRDLVQRSIFRYLTALHSRVLDIPAQVVDGYVAMVLRDPDAARQKILDSLHDELSLAMKSCRADIVEHLRRLRPSGEDSLDELLMDEEEVLS